VRQLALLLLLLVPGAGSCARGPRAPAEAIPQAEWSLTVKNHHWLDVSIQVIYDGQRSRVGTVPVARAQTYVLPSFMIGTGRTIRLEANPVGSPRRMTTEAFTVQGGQHVEWTLETELDRSTVLVR
jgi:hypothetical protein